MHANVVWHQGPDSQSAMLSKQSRSGKCTLKVVCARDAFPSQSWRRNRFPISSAAIRGHLVNITPNLPSFTCDMPPHFLTTCVEYEIFFLKLEMKLNDSKIIEELLTLLLQLVTIITQVEIKLHISCPRLSAYVLWTYQFTNIKHDVVLLKKIIILRKK